MSGGSYDYFYQKLNDFVDDLKYTDINPRRKILKKVLVLVSEACHAIEWVDSGDWGVDQENEVLDKLFKVLSKKDSTKKVLLYEDLMEVLEQYKKAGKDVGKV